VNIVVFFVVKYNYVPHLERRKICLINTKILLQLAWELLSEKCANIIFSLKEILLSPDFISRNRRSDKDFTRQRKLPFHLLFSFLINFVKGSYQDELDKFFQAINGYPVAKRVVTKGALAKARLKLKFEAFEELNRHLIKLFEKVFTPKTWCGFRLVAGDSTTIRLPRIDEIAQHFGVWKADHALWLDLRNYLTYSTSFLSMPLSILNALMNEIRQRRCLQLFPKMRLCFWIVAIQHFGSLNSSSI